MQQPYPIYCINLKHETERRQRMEKRGEELGIKIDFIEGLTPNDAETAQLITQHGLKRRQKLFKNGLTPAEHSCFASHVKALKTFMASSDAHCIILEDNVELFKNFPDFLRELVGAKIEYDILRLETRKKCKIDFPYRKLKTFELRFTPCATLGASALLFSREGAQKVLDSIEGYVYAYDTHIGHFWRYGLKTICVAPHVACRAERKAVPSVIDALDKEEQLETREAEKYHGGIGKSLSRLHERLRHSLMKYSTSAWWSLKSRFGN